MTIQKNERSHAPDSPADKSRAPLLIRIRTKNGPVSTFDLDKAAKIIDAGDALQVELVAIDD